MTATRSTPRNSWSLSACIAANVQVCREAKGPCDAEEKCDGYSKKCPKDYCIDYRKELKKDEPYCPVKKY